MDQMKSWQVYIVSLAKRGKGSGVVSFILHFFKINVSNGIGEEN